MKVILDNIRYKGHDIKHFECNISAVENVDGLGDKILDYIIYALDVFISDEES